MLLQVQADVDLPGPPAMKKIRMSTSLQLPAGNKDSGLAFGSQKQQAGRSKGPSSTAAQGIFPPEVERYMQSQGFVEATPIQQQYVLSAPCCLHCDALGFLLFQCLAAVHQLLYGRFLLQVLAGMSAGA